jgi:hypothetical protein
MSPTTVSAAAPPGRAPDSAMQQALSVGLSPLEGVGLTGWCRPTGWHMMGS